MSDAKVSILIPCYNSELYIAETLRSCFNQEYNNYEIILVDDGSNDKSFEIAKSFQSSQCKIVRQDNSGACRARNLAFELCQGEYIQYLDADDLLPSNKLKVQLEKLIHGNDEKTLAYSPWLKFYTHIGDFPKDVGHWQSWQSGKDMLIAMLNGEATMCAQHGYLIPRTLVTEAGPWDERLKINQDGEFFARVLLHSSQVIFCPETEVYYRKGIGNSVSSGNLAKKQYSALLALQNIKHALLAVDDSPRCRVALGNAFANFAYTCNQLVPELSEKALQEIHSLGVRPSLKAPWKAALFSKIIGFPNFLALKRWLQ